jgi:hypothetical protein
MSANFFLLLEKKQAEGDANDTGNDVAGTVTDVVLSSIEQDKKTYHQIWIGYSSVSSHYCNDNEESYEYKTILEEIMVRNRNVMIAEKSESYAVWNTTELYLSYG